jgi:hypothetical protein
VNLDDIASVREAKPTLCKHIADLRDDSSNLGDSFELDFM